MFGESKPTIEYASWHIVYAMAHLVCERRAKEQTYSKGHRAEIITRAELMDRGGIYPVVVFSTFQGEI